MNLEYVAEVAKALQPLCNQSYKGALFTVGSENTSALIEVVNPDYADIVSARAVSVPMRL